MVIDNFNALYSFNNNYTMLDFVTQKKILEPLLKDPRNHLCADCDAVSPTWVSLDFGIFICSNCAGAHRALGPTITRVRSVNLDKWQNEWVDNMLLSNVIVNGYWAADPRSQDKKPKMGASPNDVERYVFQKYVKRKFVKDTLSVDPLRAYKNGDLKLNEVNVEEVTKPKPIEILQKSSNTPNVVTQISPPIVQNIPKQQVCLLDFDNEPIQHAPTMQTLVNQPQQPQHPQQQPDQQQFTEFTQIGTSFTSETSKQVFVNFQTLMNQQKLTPQLQHSFSTQHMFRQPLNIHHPYNPVIGQHNLVYNAHFQQHQQMPYPHFPGQTHTHVQQIPPQQPQYQYQQGINPGSYGNLNQRQW